MLIATDARKASVQGQFLNPSTWRNEVVKPNISHGADKYAPFVITLFFFILFNNLLGLIPYGSTPTAGISVTLGLAFLVFLVPFGAFLTGPLQHFTAQFIEVGLNLLGIPNFVTDLTIEIPTGTCHGAEACAGLRFLIAAPSITGHTILLDGGQRFLSLPRDVQFLEPE